MDIPHAPYGWSTEMMLKSPVCSARNRAKDIAEFIETGRVVHVFEAFSI